MDVALLSTELSGEGTLLREKCVISNNAPLRALLGWADVKPYSVAVVAFDGSFTFAELRSRAAAVAAELLRRGVGTGSAVEIATGYSRATAAAYLACWLVNATAVPIDPSLPERRGAFIRSDAAVDVTIDAELFDCALELGSDEAEFIRRAMDMHRDDVASAYIVYTSGTTGEPKGVEVGYDCLDNLCGALRSLELRNDGVGINPVSPAYDGWLWCFLLYLISGQRMHVEPLAAESGALSAAEVIALVGPSTVCVTPTILRELDEHSLSAEVLVVAGEVCTSDLIERFSTGRRMLNVYGPTETTIAATWADSLRGDDLTTIGRPMPGYGVLILDPAGEPVACGQIGELYIRGRGVAKGYRNRPALTASRFLRDTFDGVSSRMYRTGDLACQRADGQIEYHARNDAQIKLRGFRIELTEIEAVALRDPEVRGAAAYAQSDQSSLGLAIVGCAGGRPDLAQLRVALSEELPRHARPAAIVVLPAIPLLPTGKVDRRTLARAGRVTQCTVSRGPETSTEQRVLQRWREKLDRVNIGLTDDFFDIGGHSLLAAQVISALRRDLEVPLTVRDLFEHPTVEGLSAAIDERGKTAS